MSSSLSIPIPMPVRRGSHSAASSPCSSYSDSDASAGSWAPAGVYVPIHKRSSSSRSSSRFSAASSPPTSAPPSPSNPKASLPAHMKPATRPFRPIYSRDELLALAPTALVYNALRPTVTPALVAQHPSCLRMRGDGIARALEMAKLPAAAHSLRLRAQAPMQELSRDPGHNHARGRRSRRSHASAQAQGQEPAPKLGQHQEDTQNLETSRTRHGRRSGRRRPHKTTGNSGSLSGFSEVSNKSAGADAVRSWREPHATAISLH